MVDQGSSLVFTWTIVGPTLTNAVFVLIYYGARGSPAQLPRGQGRTADRSFKVLFPDFDLYVDAVPARIAGQYLEIPDRRRDDAGESGRLGAHQPRGTHSTIDETE